MHVAFTLCSNNYLAQAKALADGFLKFHPDFKFFIGLVDEFNEAIDYTYFEGCELLLADVVVEDINQLQEKFNIIELNTSVKPYYFKYFFEVEKAQKVIYLDPDILVYSRFDEVISLLDDYHIIVTPQLCSPIDDGHHPIDQDLLVTGTFNLGFIALSHFNKVSSFLQWWRLRVTKYGYGRPSDHMFYDQLLINLVPAFFEDFFVLRHLGYNMAGWNLYERSITSLQEGEILINNSVPLRFFHFSGYKFSHPDVICNYNNRFNFNTRQDVRTIFEAYHQIVMKNKYESFNKIVPLYVKSKVVETKPNPTFSQKLKYRLRRTARVFLGYE